MHGFNRGTGIAVSGVCVGWGGEGFREQNENAHVAFTGGEGGTEENKPKITTVSNLNTKQNSR